MATVTFIKYQKQSAGGCMAWRGMCLRHRKPERRTVAGWSVVKTVRPSWRLKSLWPLDICTTKIVRSGSTTTSSLSIPRNRSLGKRRTSWPKICSTGLAGQRGAHCHPHRCPAHPFPFRCQCGVLPVGEDASPGAQYIEISSHSVRCTL